MSCPAILEKNINRLNDLFVLLDLSPSEQKNIMEIAEKFPISIPAYYLSLINKEDKNDPIRKMAIPSEFEKDLEGTFDTSGEGDNTVITGMQHKYNETVMILSTNQCAMYCRHCFRKRLVGLSDEEIAKAMQPFFEDTSLEDLEIVAHKYKEIDAWSSDPLLKEESLNRLMDVMIEGGEIDEKVPYDSLVTTTYAEKAIESVK